MKVLETGARIVGKLLHLLVVLSFIASLLGAPVPTAADTSHSGAISSNETWTPAASPHIITGDVTVNTGVTLTIEAGCEVRFGGNYQLQVNGTLKAQGTPASLITFTSNKSPQTNGDWKYINFANSDAGSILDYCDLSYGGSSYGILYLSSTANNVTISHCTIQKSQTAGIYLYNSSPAISDCYISANTGHGIHLASTSSPTITNCTLNGNAGHGIYTEDNSCDPTITSCSITSNSGCALRLSAYAVTTMSGVTITGNNPDAIEVPADDVPTGTWDDPVPYIILGDISIPDGKTLTLAAGAQLRFNGNYQLTVAGALKAQGTPASHITFTSYCVKINCYRIPPCCVIITVTEMIS